MASDATISKFLREGQWDYLYLAVLPSGIGEAVQGSFFCFGTDPDNLVWLLDPSGVFSMRFTYQLVRPARAQSWAFTYIW